MLPTSTSDSTWLAAITDDYLFLEYFSRQENIDYPDQGCSIEIYTSPTYSELEILSPIHHLQVGEEFRFRVEWELESLRIRTGITELRSKVLKRIESLTEKP